MANKYKGDNKALENLTKKVISGGSGVWGETAMAGHPQLSTADASEMVKYILNIANEKPKEKGLPTKGMFTAKIPSTDKGKGVYIVRAAYEDQGANGLPSLKSEQSFVLKNSKIDPHGFDEYTDINKMAFGGRNLAIPAKSGSYMAMKQIDLAGLKELVVMATAPKPQLNAVGGKVELRLGSPKGQLLGESAFLEASETMDFNPKMVIVPINLTGVSTDKLQDVYAIFVNTKAEGSLMVVMGLEFKLANEGESIVEPKKDATSANDFFVGKWATKMIGTPGGDVSIEMVIERNNGVLSGKMISQQMGSQAFEKVEEIDGEKIKLSFSANGMNLNMELSKEDADNIKGKLMGMIEVKGSRIK